MANATRAVQDRIDERKEEIFERVRNPDDDSDYQEVRYQLVLSQLQAQTELCSAAMDAVGGLVTVLAVHFAATDCDTTGRPNDWGQDD